MKINEMFYSIQGEGPDIGMPAVFIRTSGCNLNCSWCDTNHEDGVNMSNEEIISDVLNVQEYRDVPNVVITGGEPLIQPGITELILELSRKRIVHVETNGTIFLPRIIGFCKVIVRPKLAEAASTPDVQEYMLSLSKWVRYATFKFVVNSTYELLSVAQLIEDIKPKYPVYIMPRCTEANEMKTKLLALTELIKRKCPSARIAPRLQIFLYGNTRGT